MGAPDLGARWPGCRVIVAALRLASAALLLCAAPHGLAAVPVVPTTLAARAPAPTQDQVADGASRLTDGLYSVGYWPGSERLARHVLAEAPRLAELPALPDDWMAGEEIRIYLAPDAATFSSLTGGRAPHWSAGVALPAAGLIIIPLHSTGSARDLERVLRHELAHVALHRHLRGRHIPRWFDEGYARWASGQWDRGSAWELRLAFAFRRGPPLDSIALTWPARATEASAAYLLSASAVAFLADRSSERGLEIFLDRWREGGAMDPAFRQTFGMTIGQFEEHWRRAVRRQYGWTFFLSHTIVFWFFVGLLLIWLYGRRRRRDALRLEQLRATEPPDSPAYWLGEEPMVGGIGQADGTEPSDSAGDRRSGERGLDSPGPNDRGERARKRAVE